ncbi:MAG: 50S ribosomal protein L15 [Promethearchaeota archaeon CR_4]|nr:ribosomal protein L15 [uncultured bacterium]OLS15075.1 MAG: 50S ribosomal protein L15 [Candidatus Lokiarchaeota archaeon CR_4]
MTRNFSKDTRTRRGLRTHGYGRVTGHGRYGGHGGKGKTTGRFKHKKTFMWKQKALGWPDPDWRPGKDGFQRPQKVQRLAEVNAINVRDLDVTVDKWVEKGVAQKKGSSYVVNLGDIDVQKILGTGKISKKVEVTVDKASARAVEKIQKAGGKVILAEK